MEIYSSQLEAFKPHRSILNISSKLSSMHLISTLDAATPASFRTNADRDAACEAAYRFLGRVESPWRRTWDLAMDHPAYVASLKICLDLDLFQKWHDAGDGKKTFKELESLAGVPVEALSKQSAPFSEAKWYCIDTA